MRSLKQDHEGSTSTLVLVIVMTVMNANIKEHLSGQL
jgi:hypothetical protein